MRIVVATSADWPKIQVFVNRTGYFDPIEPPKLGGNWIVLYSDTDEVIGTIWWFEGQGHAYIDYWVGVGVRSGAAVALALEKFLASRGINHVHGIINANNTRAIRTALRLGMGTTTAPYCLVTKEL